MLFLPMKVGVISKLYYKKVYNIRLQKLFWRNRLEQAYGTGLSLEKVEAEQGWVTWFW